MALAMKAPPDNPLTEMSVASTLTDGRAPLPVPLAEKAKRRKAPSWYFIIFSVVVTDSCVVLSVEVRLVFLYAMRHSHLQPYTYFHESTRLHIAFNRIFP